MLIMQMYSNCQLTSVARKDHMHRLVAAGFTAWKHWRLSLKPFCVCPCVDIRVLLEQVPALFTARVTVHVTLCPFLLDTEAVEWERESSPHHLATVLIGWLLLTEHVEQTGRALLPSTSTVGFHWKISFLEFPLPGSFAPLCTALLDYLQSLPFFWHLAAEEGEREGVSVPWMNGSSNSGIKALFS